VAVAQLETRVAAVRRFNRFYTQKIGILGEGLLDSRFSLAEARVLYELARRDQPTAAEIGRELGLDPGYLSRILRGFRRQGLVERVASDSDRRQGHLSLTEAGHAAFAPLDEASRAEIAGLIAPLTDAGQRRLLAAMHNIERMLEPGSARREPYLLRPPEPGEIGWVVSRHGAIYAEEYGWDAHFEGLVAEIAAKFVTEFDPRRERCWIAERDGEPAGSVFLVKDTESTAKLRLLLVEPTARGLGLGARLVAECIGFARQARYDKLTLWTQSCLVAARRIYQAAGFQLVHSEPHRSFGHDLVGEHWDLAL
jgi:DNA-binding MarR family transcriptional regulator/N-acetylglutamate synthase-like GNAT family acetyltransferase